MARKNTLTKFVEDLVDSTKDFVDDLVDRAKDVEEDVRDAAKNLVDDEDETPSVKGGELAELNKAIADLTKKVNELSKSKAA
jgi:polyhydroxyalkanoate synthesis regulator phasin